MVLFKSITIFVFLPGTSPFRYVKASYILSFREFDKKNIVYYPDFSEKSICD